MKTKLTGANEETKILTLEKSTAQVGFEKNKTTK